MSGNKRPANPRQVIARDLALLCRKLRDMAADWDIYGLCLGIPQDRINDIVAKKRDVKKGVTRCMKDLLQYWAKENSNPTWEQLHTAAVRMEQNALASDIKREHDDLKRKVDLRSEDNIDAVIHLLGPVVSDWHSFGLQLDIEPFQLKKIAGEAHVFLEDMLDLYITLKNEEATIDHLITTIRCNLIQNNALADRLSEDDELQQYYAHQQSRDQHNHESENEEHLMHTNEPVTINVQPTDHLTDGPSGEGHTQDQNSHQTSQEPMPRRTSQEPIPHQTSQEHRPQPHAEIRERAPQSRSSARANEDQGIATSIEPSDSRGTSTSQFGRSKFSNRVLTWTHKYPKSTVVLVIGCILGLYLTYCYFSNTSRGNS